MSRIDLPDGTSLDVVDNADPLFGVDSDTGRTARWEPATSRLLDSDGKVIREVGKAPERANTKPRKASGGKGTTGVAKSGAADRFATFNGFMDTVARHLSPVEIVVWSMMWRDCRNGTATTSHRDIARRSGCSLRAVNYAIRRLRVAGLIEPTRLSRHRGEPSDYAVNPNPERCVPTITDMRTTKTGATIAPDESCDDLEAVQPLHRIEK